MPPKFWAEKTRTVLRRWLAAEEDVAAPPPDKGDGDKWYDGSEIESLSMEQILSEGIAEGRDKVFIIALNDFSAAVGDKWDRLKTKVDLISDNAARRHLERGSLYQNIGEGVYLVTVQVSGGADCQAKVFAMAEDLGRRLVGDRFVSLASSGVAVAEADASLLLDAHGRFDPEAVTRLARDPDNILPPPPPTAAVAAEPVGRMVPLEFEVRDRLEARLVANAPRLGDEIDIGASGTRDDPPDRDPAWATAEGGGGDLAVVASATRADGEFDQRYSVGSAGADRAFGESGDGRDRGDAAVPISGERADRAPLILEGGGGGRRDGDPRWDSGDRGERAIQMVSDGLEAKAEAAWVGIVGAETAAASTTAEETAPNGKLRGDVAGWRPMESQAKPLSPGADVALSASGLRDPELVPIAPGGSGPRPPGREVAITAPDSRDPALVPMAAAAGRSEPDWREGEVAAKRPDAASSADPPTAGKSRPDLAPPPPPSDRASPPPPDWAEQAKPEGGADAPRLVAIDHCGQASSVPEWLEIIPMAPKPKAAERETRANFAMIGTLWRPCWAIGSGRVESHLCRPVLREGKKLRAGNDLLRLLDGNTERLDYETLLAAVVGLSAAGGRRLGTLILPLTYQTLHLDGEMARILPALAAIAGLGGVGRLLVEVAEVPPAAHSDHLVRILAPLRQRTSGILLRRSLVAPQWRADSVGDLAGIGLDLAELEQWQRGSGPLAESMRRFRAQIAPIPAYAWNFSTSREVATANDAGFALGNGANLTPDLPQPQPEG